VAADIHTLSLHDALPIYQYPGHGNDKRYSTTFMHQPTVFFSGLNQLASLTQYPVVYFAMRKIKRGYYETRVVPIADPPYEKEKTDRKSTRLNSSHVKISY